MDLSGKLNQPKSSFNVALFSIGLAICVSNLGLRHRALMRDLLVKQAGCPLLLTSQLWVRNLIKSVGCYQVDSSLWCVWPSCLDDAAHGMLCAELYWKVVCLHTLSMCVYFIYFLFVKMWSPLILYSDSGRPSWQPLQTETISLPLGRKGLRRLRAHCCRERLCIRGQWLGSEDVTVSASNYQNTE